MRRRGASVRRFGLLPHALAVLGLFALAIGIAQPWAMPTVTPRQSAAAAPTPGQLLLGADVSWPSCRSSASALPGGAAFAVVGVNDGVPDSIHRCVGREVTWGTKASGASKQPKLAFYLIGADPFAPAEKKWVKPHWPKSSVVADRNLAIPSTFGVSCRGERSPACGYVFGWATAGRSIAAIPVAHPDKYRYWIDVEIERDWNDDRLMNEAIIEGMVAYISQSPLTGGLGASAGLYSNVKFWDAIVGDLRRGSPLDELPEWYPVGEVTRAEAEQAFRSAVPFTPKGHVDVIQYWHGGVDYDLAEAG